VHWVHAPDEHAHVLTHTTTLTHACQLDTAHGRTWHRLIDPEPSTGDEVWIVKERGAHHTPIAHGVGLSATQYDGYAYKLKAAQHIH
jgi:hypothetical protein